MTLIKSISIKYFRPLYLQTLGASCLGLLSCNAFLVLEIPVL